jgi:glycosyltransferase involved in cell wall biosynthesis
MIEFNDEMNKRTPTSGVSIIIPAFNEEAGISKVLEEILLEMNKSSIDYEIVVVDDGSTDRTVEIVREEGIEVVQHFSNRGYGAAIKTGITKVKYDSIVITDADGTYPNERICELVSIFENEKLDMVVGSRVGKNVKIPLIRRPAKWAITKLANCLSGRKIPDINSGLRVMKKSVVNKFINILPDGFSLTTTITLAMLTNNHSVKYIPIDYFSRKCKSKIRPIYDTLNFIQLIIRTVLYFNPIKVFAPLSIILLVLAFVVLIVSWQLTGKAMDVTFGVILMTAVMVMAIGMLADLIDKRTQK